MVEQLPLNKNVLTGDALYCQRDICAKVLKEGGDYLVIVKRNQPTLYDSIALAFDQPVRGESYGYAQEHNRHGGRQESRRLWSTTALNDYLDWPGVQQVCKIEREAVEKGKVSRKVRYAITSMGSGVKPKTLLSNVRGHWRIENRLHYVRDVTLGEDASQVRTGAAPQVMAVIRNITLALLRLNRITNVAAAFRHYAWQPNEALKLLGLFPT